MDAIGKAWALGTDSQWVLANVGPAQEFRERDLMAVVLTNPRREVLRLTALF